MASPNTTGAYFVGVDISGKAWAWGTSNKNGDVGDGTTTTRSSPVSVISSATFVATAGNLLIDTNNNVWSWGLNTAGLVGDGTIDNKSSPIQINGAFNGKAIAVANGEVAKYVLTSEGYCYSWGANTFGQLGDNTTINKSSPVSVVGNRRFKKIAAANGFVLALDNDGIVWAWGSNSNGQLGTSSYINYSSPISINQGTLKFINIAAGYIGAAYGQSIAQDTDGNIWTWGYVDLAWHYHQTHTPEKTNTYLYNNLKIGSPAPVSAPVSIQRWKEYY